MVVKQSPRYTLSKKLCRHNDIELNTKYQNKIDKVYFQKKCNTSTVRVRIHMLTVYTRHAGSTKR